ncbi:MAG TPA: LysM peptidoglycan-binding domain-containing protein [Pirellulaceae bacterium]|jgi:DNA-directed RNA polymerase subunit H (RpoH/RPB5)|nr:LysM peptidoglycan-binding domain-containing protein [Pirellulaceae bacterium]
MNNMLKTIFVVSVLGGALYGAYVLLNENEFQSRQQAAQNVEEPRLDLDMGSKASSEADEPGPWGFEEVTPSPAIPERPPAPRSFPPENSFPPQNIATEGVTPVPPADLLPGGPGSSATENLPPNATPVDPYAVSTTPPATPATGPDFETNPLYASSGASGPEEPSDLQLPPDLPGSSYPSPEGAEFQMADGAAPPTTPNFGDVAASESNVTGFEAAPGAGTSGIGAAAADRPAAIEAARQNYLRAVDAAKGHVALTNYRDALAALSVIYGNPDLPSPEKEELRDLLDALAGKVIYSQEHLHQPAHVVQPGDTLDSIAAAYSITPEFLARINGLDPSNRSAGEPGTSLKVVRGPFRAEVRLRSNVAGTLTLYLGELYAGRFDVELGQDNPPFPGKYKVHDKQADRPFYTADGSIIPAEAPENPYGGRWIDLGSGISLHGGPATAPPGGRLGCMSLPGEGQASDLFAILSLSSTVEVRQ